MLRDVVIPDLGVGDIPILAGPWHIEPGREVIEGDTLLTLRAGGILVHLPAPCNGLLRRTLVDPNAILRPGDRVAVLLCEEDDED